MAYSELIKNFNRIRGYMREFYVYGFKHREEFGKSARTYDDERRRLEGWLGDFMRFRYTPEGKAVFFSFDCKHVAVNPFFQALRAKSFTDGDITLHFYIFSLLASSETKATARELLDSMTVLLSEFPDAPVFDESTLRKKLKEYCELGLLRAIKQGNKLYYSRVEDCPLPNADALAFFSEVSPCGALAYYLISDMVSSDAVISYKHHHVSMALESEVLYALLSGIREKREVEISFKNSRERVLPLAIFVGTQTGRRSLVSYSLNMRRLNSYRLDRILSVKTGEFSPLWDDMRALLEKERENVWGVSFGRSWRLGEVRFTLCIEEGEEYVVHRLLREKRCGTVTQIDEHTYEFCMEVYDASELIPWIRTFLGRIVKLNFTDRVVENRIKRDFLETCALYGIGEDDV